jgi:hypothetical protein
MKVAKRLFFESYTSIFLIWHVKENGRMQLMTKIHTGLLVASILLLTGSPGLSMDASTVTILATVTDGYQLVDDAGQPYEVENTTTGNELVLNHVGSKVEVTGTVQDEVDYKIIVVESFRVVEE